ncbi:CIS tube protein [Phytohabitans suffuscus]|uniref:Peptidase M23 n=1 Tax=Phytohabitans suffuscus TaxID=624315 RepID=A0A6F8YRI3_9ACTN|nr:LysM peptidoglycan-binding domain-containing protein [Phytohabitans suffuscus]BCB88712.1 peptidase M23 [Phytohabitans suffuscus]
MAFVDAHTGFAERAMASLVCLSPPAAGRVPFTFNPEEVRVTRRVDLRSRGTVSDAAGIPKGSTGSIFRKAPPAEISLSNVVFDGASTKLHCDQLLNWMSPGGGAAGQMAGMGLSVMATKIRKAPGGLGLATKMPELVFQWGPPMAGFTMHVVLHMCTIAYKRFNPAGIPIRAMVSMTLTEEPNLLSTLPTNPTSGGEPGRARHTVTSGESLHSIATDRYGAPGYWRALAGVNDIDDPLRVRPGQVVYLPNQDELAKRD